MHFFPNARIPESNIVRNDITNYLELLGTINESHEYNYIFALQEPYDERQESYDVYHKKYKLKYMLSKL